MSHAKDPFAYTKPIALKEKRNYIAKAKFVQNKTPFDVLRIEEATGVQSDYGVKNEFRIDVEYVDEVENALATGTITYSVSNPKGETTRRDIATRAMKDMLEAGEKFAGYYLIGSGPSFTLSATKPID